MPYPIEKTPAQWQALLHDKGAEPLAYAVTREGATERPYTGALENEHGSGQYRCICCDQVLFDATAKFDSGCGWPSYTTPVQASALEALPDHSLGMRRTEVRCSQCGAHLGHVFEDGPAPTGLRYCMNSASLHFVPK